MKSEQIKRSTPACGINHDGNVIQLAVLLSMRKLDLVSEPSFRLELVGTVSPSGTS